MWAPALPAPFGIILARSSTGPLSSVRRSRGRGMQDFSKGVPTDRSHARQVGTAPMLPKGRGACSLENPVLAPFALSPALCLRLGGGGYFGSHGYQRH